MREGLKKHELIRKKMQKKSLPKKLSTNRKKILDSLYDPIINVLKQIQWKFIYDQC